MITNETVFKVETGLLIWLNCLFRPKPKVFVNILYLDQSCLLFNKSLLTSLLSIGYHFFLPSWFFFRTSARSPKAKVKWRRFPRRKQAKDRIDRVVFTVKKANKLLWITESMQRQIMSLFAFIHSFIHPFVYTFVYLFMY